MEHLVERFVQGLSLPLVFVLIAVCLAVLGWAADWLVKEAVALSERSGVPKIVIGATVVSLGTTTPEAAVSVMAALQGDPSLALGNAVGSIICDTGLILGIACLISPLPLPPNIVNRQGWVQLGAGFLLVALSWPWAAPATAFETGGGLPQVAGFFFLALLVAYLWMSVRWSMQGREVAHLEELESDVTRPVPIVLLKLVAAVAVIIVASHVLIPSAQTAALRIGVPEEVIAATLVAFGTSLPELVTAVAAARHGHGDLAVGNVVGADILNVLFVAGASAAVTPGGLTASPQFFVFLFPAMLAVLVIFRIGIFVSGRQMPRFFGAVLLAVYVAVTALSFAVEGV